MTTAEDANRPYTIRYEGGRRLIEKRITTTDAGEVIVQHDFPDTLTHHYSPGAINEAINLFHGEYLIGGDTGVPHEGHISYEWFPSPSIQARGERETKLSDFVEFAKQANEKPTTTWVDMTQVSLPGPLSGALPGQPSGGPAPWTKRAGSYYRHDRLGPQIHGSTSELSRVTFLIPNGWIALYGAGICEPQTPVVTWYGRLRVVSGDWEITVDQRRGLNNVDFSRSLKDSGGYYITHIGQIRRHDGSSFDYEDVEWVLDTLRLSFSLACGRSINPVLPVGWRADEAVMADWTARPVDPYRTVATWRDEAVAEEQVARLIECMMTYCEVESRREAVRYAVSYYVTANFDLDVELMVAVPISGLQLLSYFHFVEERALFSRRRFNDLNTESQVRLLLDDCGIATSVPAHMAHLAAVAASVPLDKPNDPPPDALGSVIFLRNKVIHPTKQKPGSWSAYEWAEAGTASRHFLVMAILNTVGYDGQHHSMLALNRGLGATTAVPWAQTPGTP